MLSLIGAAGPRGIRRGDLGSQIELDRETLDDFLDGLFRLNMIAVTDFGGEQVIHARAMPTARAIP